MPAPEDVRRYSRDYYLRVKSDPQRYAALRERKLEQQRIRRLKQRGASETSGRESEASSEASFNMRHHLGSLLESCGEFGDRDQVFAEGIRLANEIPAQEGESLPDLAERRNEAAGEALAWWGIE